MVALNKALEIWGVKKLGLATPYTDDVQEAIVRNYRELGVEIGKDMERHLRVEKSTDIADIGQQELEGMVGHVTAAGVDAVTTFCTNLNAAQWVEKWEKKYETPVFDTVTTVVWDMLRNCGVDMKRVEGVGHDIPEGIANSGNTARRYQRLQRSIDSYSEFPVKRARGGQKKANTTRATEGQIGISSLILNVCTYHRH